MRDTKLFERISSEPDICHGKPCIKGTRIPVYLIVSLISEGEDTGAIIQDYPSVTPDDIKAALKYAAKLCEYEEHDAWIVTRDSDFKNYRKFSEYNIRGIILFTVNDTRTPNILKLMNRFLEMYSEKLSTKNLITIEDEEVKIYTSE